MKIEIYIFSEPHHDSYDEGYGGDVYSGEPSHEPRSAYRSKRSTSLSSSCFSSPPEDCGADCVTSFRKGDGCYQCCCPEKTGELIVQDSSVRSMDS